MMALCIIYAERANVRLGSQKRFLIDWPVATALTLLVIVVGVVVAGKDASVPDDSSVVLALARTTVSFHAVGIAWAVFAAFVLWQKERWYLYASAVLSLALMALYFTWPVAHTSSNLVLIVVAIGLSLLGRITTRRGFIVAYMLLVVFDIYAVWGSDLMNVIENNYPSSFPKGLEVGGRGWSRGMGAGDVFFSAIASNHIHQHQGIRRACLFAMLCTVGILIGLLSPSKDPLLIFVSPIAITILLAPKGWLRID